MPIKVQNLKTEEEIESLLVDSTLKRKLTDDLILYGICSYKTDKDGGIGYVSVGRALELIDEYKKEKARQSKKQIL
jgi:hypothetical protein